MTQNHDGFSIRELKERSVPVFMICTHMATSRNVTTMMSIEQSNVRGRRSMKRSGITVGLVGVHVYRYRWDHDSGTRNPVQLFIDNCQDVAAGFTGTAQGCQQHLGVQATVRRLETEIFNGTRRFRTFIIDDASRATMALDYTPLREKTLLNSLVAQPRVWDSALASKDKLVVGRGCERDTDETENYNKELMNDLINGISERPYSSYHHVCGVSSIYECYYRHP
ncbi:hypothetical protein F5146DRAFT_376015 [Armillaria mellea]|nr:hypothetical protein F5146DRAFT_376015 [Armillaria mellea]